MGPTKRVLILFPYENNFPGFFYYDTALRSALSAKSNFQVDFYTETMDLLRFPHKQYFEELVHLYQQKYTGRNLDLIIATLGPARDFLTLYHGELFPGTPVLYVDLDTRTVDGGALNPPGPIVTGRFDVEGTLDLALELHPDVRDVYVVGGASPGDRELEGLAAKVFRSFSGRISFNYLCGLSMPDLLQKVAAIREPSLIFFLNFLQDADGKAFLPARALSLLAEKAGVPIYGMSDSFVGSGIVGGRLYSFSKLGDKTAQSALRLLSGEDPRQIEPLEEAADQTVFDCRQLNRWAIREASLPPGSIVRHKDFSVWERYRLHILVGVSVLLLQAVLISALVFNLARRRQANRELVASEEKLQKAADEWKTTFDTLPDLIMVLDQDFRIVRVNQATAAFFGLPVERLVGNTCTTVLGGAPEPFDPGLLQRSLDTKELQEEEILVDGRDVWFLVSAAPILNGRGEISGFLHAARDVTERKRAETDARRRMSELAHVTRVATMGELAASLAHEINQPLTAILSNAQAAQRFLSISEPDVDEVRQILEDIVRDDKRVSEVIRRMRVLLKKQTVSCERFSLDEAVMECIALVNSASPLDGLSMEARLDGCPILVRGDRVQVQQVLFNLIINAAAAMKSAPSASRKLVISAAAEEMGTVKVSVTDSGTGIDEHNADRLFEPFYTTKPEGMGMGLSISQTIIKAHGGTMGGENNPAGGATFYFTLPSVPG
ncbi:MAG: ATP-binding protein [Syntrophobacteraceae bacterium]